MRKAIFTVFLLLGIGCGLLSARNDDWGMQIVMMAIGAMFGGALGGALSQVGKGRGNRLPLETEEELEPIVMTRRNLGSQFRPIRG